MFSSWTIPTVQMNLITHIQCMLCLEVAGATWDETALHLTSCCCMWAKTWTSEGFSLNWSNGTLSRLCPILKTWYSCITVICLVICLLQILHCDIYQRPLQIDITTLTPESSLPISDMNPRSGQPGSRQVGKLGWLRKRCLCTCPWAVAWRARVHPRGFCNDVHFNDNYQDNYYALLYVCILLC